MTTRVTCYGGPGTGKSTTTALVFGALKQKGRNVEIVPEYAKEIVWEQRSKALSFQPYMMAKQMMRERRLEGQVEAILTDTSTLYSLIYGTEENGVTLAFRNWILDDYARHDRLDFFLTRDPSRGYNPKGRTQTRGEAMALDSVIVSLLDTAGVPFEVVQVDKTGNAHVEHIVRAVEQHLDN